jgi:hypothetical protein
MFSVEKPFSVLLLRNCYPNSPSALASDRPHRAPLLRKPKPDRRSLFRIGTRLGIVLPHSIPAVASNSKRRAKFSRTRTSANLARNSFRIRTYVFSTLKLPLESTPAQNPTGGTLRLHLSAKIRRSPNPFRMTSFSNPEQQLLWNEVVYKKPGAPLGRAKVYPQDELLRGHKVGGPPRRERFRRSIAKGTLAIKSRYNSRRSEEGSQPGSRKQPGGGFCDT